MRMTTYLAILAFGILLTTLARADQPGQYPYPQQKPQYYPQQEPQYYPQQQPQYHQQPPCVQCAPRPTCVRCAPLPIQQYPIDQSIYCPPNVNVAPPVLPYPGPQVRNVPVPRPFGGACSLRPAGRGFYEIVLNGVQPIYSGYGPNVQAVLRHYQQIGVCQRIY